MSGATSKNNLRIEGATIVAPDPVYHNCSLLIENSKISKIENALSVDTEYLKINASGMTIFPGLINPHDHFRGTWLPRCGNPPYTNVYEWLLELHAKPESMFTAARMRDQIGNKKLYQLGAYKNLFSGVTTALDHYMRTDEPIYENLPIRMITEYGRESLWRAVEEPEKFPSWGWGIEKEIEYTGDDKPFIIHMEEGFDSRTRGELPLFSEKGWLRHNTQLVHGLGFDMHDIEQVQKADASIVWCPATYDFLYNLSGDVTQWIRNNVNVALGTDSCLTGGVNMIDEIRIATEKFKEWFSTELLPEVLTEMVTVNAARAVMRHHDLGQIKTGFNADILIINKKMINPCATLQDFQTQDIDLLLLEGKPLLANKRHQSLFNHFYSDNEFSTVNIHNVEMLVIGDPENLLKEIQQTAGPEFNPAFLPFTQNSSGA